MSLRAQDDFERGAAARHRAHRERAADRGRTLAHVLQALAGTLAGGLEARAVVVERDEPVDTPSRNRQPRLARACVTASVRQPLLHDAEDLDLLVRREVDAGV